MVLVSGCKDVPLHPLVDEKGKWRENPNHFNPSPVFMCEQEVERYPSEASEESEDLQK